MKLNLKPICDDCKYACTKLDDHSNFSWYCGNENSGLYHDEIMRDDTCDFWEPYINEEELDPHAYPDRNDKRYEKNRSRQMSRLKSTMMKNLML